jgi:hypothetical protein
MGAIINFVTALYTITKYPIIIWTRVYTGLTVSTHTGLNAITEQTIRTIWIRSAIKKAKLSGVHYHRRL